MNGFLPPEFHFIRPEWLFALIPSALFFIFFLVTNIRSNQWSRAINRDLLPYLLDGGKSSGRSGLLIMLFIAWTLAGLAMAGPAWKKLPQPVQQKEDSLVIIQDLSLSFFAQDLSPDRMTRARHKLTDILKTRKEGLTALIAYSADAHTIVPLTDDVRTIENMIPALSPSIMPGYGSNVSAAIERGLQLIKNGGAGRGRILLLTDEVTEEDVESIAEILKGRSVTLSVIGVGSENGGPIPMKDGGFWKDEAGTIVVPTMDRSLLKKLAAGNGGRYSDIKLTDADLDYLLDEETLIGKPAEYQQVEREFDTWQDMGSRLVLLILPLALLAFRRGLIIALFLVIVLTSQDCQAMSWQDLWLTRDQQASRAMKENDFKGAAERFKQPGWKGAAEYLAGDYAKAAEVFAGTEDADGYYNLGNSLAKGGNLPEAIKAYDQALKLAPAMEDAAQNRELVEKLLQAQKEQQQKQGDKNQDQAGEKGDQKQEQGNSGSPSNQDDKQGDQGEKKDGSGDKEDQQNQQSGEQQSQQSQEKSGDKADNAKDAAGADSEAGTGAREEKAEEKDKASAPSPDTEDKKGDQGEEPAGTMVDGKPLSEEQQQAVEQLLRKIPDDPGGLLRRKFEYEYGQNQNRNKPNKNNKIW